MSAHLTSLKQEGKSLGFVPTMGALHEGHLSLIRLSKQTADVTICSIFVNPTQFNDPEDLKKYPVTTDNDTTLLISENTDILFLPTVEQIYPHDAPQKSYALGSIETVLEGAHRPGHFQGVAQVIDRLLSIITPDFLIMGQKDFQQIMVVQKLLELTGSQVQLISSPTLREATGLAKSSRNTRLSDSDMQAATTIYQSLQLGRSLLPTHAISSIQKQISTQLLENGFTSIDYVAICHPNNLSAIEKYTVGEPVVILIAAFIGGVRLIDNLLID